MAGWIKNRAQIEQAVEEGYGHLSVRRGPSKVASTPPKTTATSGEAVSMSNGSDESKGAETAMDMTESAVDVAKKSNDGNDEGMKNIMATEGLVAARGESPVSSADDDKSDVGSDAISDAGEGGSDAISDAGEGKDEEHDELAKETVNDPFIDRAKKVEAENKTLKREFDRLKREREEEHDVLMRENKRLRMEVDQLKSDDSKWSCVVS